MQEGEKSISESTMMELKINSLHIILYCDPNGVLCSPQACNPKYSNYDKTGSICTSENINDTLTLYRWLISAPTGTDGVTSPMKEVDFDTYFTSSKMITLDSIYFQPGSRVQCAARAVNTNGNEGLELMSPIVTISKEEGNIFLFSHEGHWDTMAYYNV